MTLYVGVMTVAPVLACPWSISRIVSTTRGAVTKSNRGKVDLSVPGDSTTRYLESGFTENHPKLGGAYLRIYLQAMEQGRHRLVKYNKNTWLERKLFSIKDHTRDQAKTLRY